MLLRYSLGLEAEARAVETAIANVVRDGIVTGDLVRPGGRAYGTTDVGAAVGASASGTIASAPGWFDRPTDSWF